MGKRKPPRRRDRRTGESPYVRHGKTPYKYKKRASVDSALSKQPPFRRRKDHVQAQLFNMEKFS